MRAVSSDVGHPGRCAVALPHGCRDPDSPRATEQRCPQTVNQPMPAAVLAGCAVGDTARDSERIADSTGSVLDDTSIGANGSPAEQATDWALLRAGDLPDGYDTLDRQVATTSARYWGGPWGDDRWATTGAAGRSRAPPHRSSRPAASGTRTAQHARSRRVRSRRVGAVRHP